MPFCEKPPTYTVYSNNFKTAPDIHCNNIGVCTVTAVLHTMGVSNHGKCPKIILCFNGEYERVHQFLEALGGFPPLGNS